MAKTRELSLEQRAQIKILDQQKLSTRKISTIMNIPHTTIAYTLRRIKENQSLRPRKHSGRPRVTSATADCQLHRLVVQHPTWSSAATAAQGSSRVSAITFLGRLVDDFDLPSRRPARKSRLSAKNIRDRMAFCRKYKHWMDVMFSDESTFSQFRTYARHVY